MNVNDTRESIIRLIASLDESQLKVEKNAFDAINTSDTALNLVKDGMACIEELSEKIKILDNAIAKTAENMKKMGELTDLIEGFAGVIAGISNKTNMLALNASIEAARAGEQGRGFAVVANQVGELAAQSSKSSKQIKSTIKSVQTFSNDMEESMGELVEVVKTQNEVNSRAGDVFKKILDAASAANDTSRSMEHEIAYQRDITDETRKVLDELKGAEGF